MPNMEQAIRERAYHLWLADGGRDGHADAYWLHAQREVLATAMADVVAPTIKTKKKSVAKVKDGAPAKSKRRVA